ncbi:MAG: hypothetical protein M0P69_03760 [Bacteroidales bacterium]|nr:hypothetical protein [Bacteroidales bacterium]
MGKATIGTYNSDSKKYTVTYNYNREAGEAIATACIYKAASLLTSQIPSAEAASASALATVNFAKALFFEQISSGDLDQLEATMAAWNAALDEYKVVKITENDLKAEYISLTKRAETITKNLPEDEELEVYCADATTTLLGSVGTIEVPNSIKPVALRPGYYDSAIHENDRDGIATPVICMTPSQAYYNYAILPGWERWNPQYRLGNITAIESGSCSVDLDGCTSQARGLNVNPGTSLLTGVGFRYMGDDTGSAFAVDDHVVVEFVDRDWTQGRVIGFAQEARGIIFLEPFTGSNFQARYDWIVDTSVSLGTGIVTLSGSYLEVERISGRYFGSDIGVYYDVRYRITDQTELSCDFYPIFHDVRSQWGDRKSEHPAQVYVSLEDASGNSPDGYASIMIAGNYGISAYEGKCGFSDNTYGVLVPVSQNSWEGISVKIKDAIPNAVYITRIYAGGSGWDFKGRIKNLQITNLIQEST